MTAESDAPTTLHRAASITKGSRVRVQILRALPLGTWSLAGVQLKTAAESVDFTGTCRHFRGDHPTAPTEIRIYVEPDEAIDWPRVEVCDCHPGGLVEVKAEQIVSVEVGDGR